jgi:hypothetical protein
MFDKLSFYDTLSRTDGLADEDDLADDGEQHPVACGRHQGRPARLAGLGAWAAKTVTWTKQ